MSLEVGRLTLNGLKIGSSLDASELTQLVSGVFQTAQTGATEGNPTGQHQHQYDEEEERKAGMRYGYWLARILASRHRPWSVPHSHSLSPLSLLHTANAAWKETFAATLTLILEAARQDATASDIKSERRWEER